MSGYTVHTRGVSIGVGGCLQRVRWDVVGPDGSKVATGIARDEIDARKAAGDKVRELEAAAPPSNARLAVAAAMWLRGGQCGRCANARWKGPEVTGCMLGQDLPGALGEVARTQAALLFQLAQQREAPRCVARVRLEIPPDAYLAQDLPPTKPAA